jgi:L-threonylcarbamoyladenylate synthase
LGDRVDLILDGGACEVGLESTIVSFSEEPPTLLRPGGLTLEEIESVIGKIRVDRNEGEAPASPGRLPRHYAPRTPIRVEDWKKTVDRYPQKRLGLLSLHGVSDPGPFQCVEVLSSRGDLREAAANLFAALRRLDERGLDLILADPPPEAGLGRAILDRLRRASHPGEIFR